MIENKQINQKKFGVRLRFIIYLNYIYIHKISIIDVLSSFNKVKNKKKLLQGFLI